MASVNQRKRTMIASLNLTKGAIMTICSDNFSCNSFKPVVVQVIDVKRVRCSVTDGCYCVSLTFSDGSHSIVGVLANNLEEFVQSGRLQKSSVVMLTRFFFSSLLCRKVLIITGLHVIMDKCVLIGNPVPPSKSNCADHSDTFDCDSDMAIVPMVSTDEDIPHAKEKKKAEEPIPACSSKQLIFHYSCMTEDEDEDDPILSANLKEFDDFWDNLITSKEIGFDKIWNDFMLELECMKLGWERDEYKNTEAECGMHRPKVGLSLTKKPDLEAATQYIHGFKNAQAQPALFCCAGTDHSAMDMFKRLCNGEIHSDDEKEEDGGEASHVDA
ncbi:uncharacterized protein LOC123907898 [Trifolium pratense]|uniref:uncharacterized protein LOC123907898 n=1 Tax=Trifolium pratense TaxID=57577 RepID=UPI001E697DD4|nr:uncharacterized protein LOC123907898 [Trifolium pratense]